MGRKWREVLTRLNDLEIAYNGSNIDDLRQGVEHFLKSCRELADWLQNGAGLNALEFVHRDKDLRICDGLAQTSKHHTREGKNDPITAWIGSIMSKSSGSSSARIEWARPSGSQGSEDALDLARVCVAAWQRFLRQHRLIA
jgi:hypothetical protein